MNEDLEHNNIDSHDNSIYSDRESWSSWRRLVLSDLERLKILVEDIQKKQNELRIETATQNTRITIYAIIGGAIISTLVTILLKFILP